MGKYIGIDLHSNNSAIVVSDEEDRMLVKQRLPNALSEIVSVLAPHREEAVGVVIESTYNWYWLVDGLMDAGYQVHLAHPSAIKKYEGLKYSGDFADAAYLAHLLRLKLLPEGYIYPREERAARDLSRKRLQLVRYRTAQILAIENILARQTGARLSGEAVKRLTAEQVEGLGFVPDVALAVEANRAVSQTLGQQIEALEKRLKERVRLRGEFKLLKTYRASARHSPPRSCSRSAHWHGLPRWATSARTAVAWIAYARATTRRKVKAIPRTATSTSHGPSWRPRTSRGATARRRRASMNARSARPTPSRRPRLWRTSWRGRATTCCANRRPSM